MSAAWALLFEPDERHFVGAWRLHEGVDVCELGDDLWLRGPDSQACNAQLAKLPIGQRFAIRPDGQLVRHGALVPHGHLPRAGWQRLRSWLEVALPTAAVPWPRPSPVSIGVVRDDQERTVNLLITTAAAWAHFAGSAAEVRLANLRFAMAEDGRVAVVGSPLPAMAGDYYCERDGIATPAGWTWSPPVDPIVLSELLRLERGDVALLSLAGDCEVLPADNFVQASRAAARITSLPSHG
jgi:hypothetical protein